MQTDFIGRRIEQQILGEALLSSEAEMVSVIGRRRVGKTFLVKHTYRGKIDFELSGIQNAQGNEQLRNFTRQLKIFFPNAILVKPPNDWLDAFFLLIEYLEQRQKAEKLIVFFDEVPWLATHKSGFLRALSYFWNSWAVNQRIVVVLCGSAASWMIKKIVRNKGGLHNRVTKRIRLQPFKLSETEEFLQSKNVNTDRYQLLQLYMAMGGIPHYLKEIKHGQSAVQNINRICFSQDGLLQAEFNSLYPALFDRSTYHVKIIRALATKQIGMTRKELIEVTKLSDGGHFSTVLEELQESGFIGVFPTYGKRLKEKLFRLTDEYSLFYLRFIEKNIHDSKTAWQTLSQTQVYKIWRGYAFENICLKHVDQIKKALKIEGIYSTASSFYKKGTASEKGAQIDLLIDRNDHIINLIESKFYSESFTISKEYATRLRQKIGVFRAATQTKKQLLLTLISTFGIQENANSIGLIDTSFNMDVLFEP